MIYFINFLTLSRILLGIVIFALLIRPEGYFLAFILFFVAGVTDYLDGFFARKYNLVSQIGEILDPIADKLLIVFLLFGLAVNLTSYYIAFVSALIISREIWVGALREFNARQLNSNVTKVTFLAKIKTTIQLFTISIYLLGLFTNNMLIILFADMFLFLTLLITIYTGFIYNQQTFTNINKKQ